RKTCCPSSTGWAAGKRPGGIGGGDGRPPSAETSTCLQCDRAWFSGHVLEACPRQSSIATTVSPPRTICPTSTLTIAVGGTNTSIRERKMLICSHAPGGAASASAGPATSTRPSAGDSTLCSSTGDTRSGSRKKKAKNRPNTTRGIAHADDTVEPAINASNKAPPI